ncbi:MAG TPA: hypothetical protein VFY90_14240 [Tepidiformaceae bacterium]|nr:hypothetical protein [Tepidiformaceae bacterium]
MPERPILTFDLDGVLCRPPFGINPGSGRHKRRDKAGKWNVLWLTEPGRYMLRRPMPGAVEGFRELSARFDCRVLSARAGHSLGFTQRWFRKHFGAVPELYLRPTWEETPAQFKVRIVQELGATAHFEDDPFTAQWVAELLPAVFLVDWGRNRWLEGERIHRIERIKDAVPLLDELRARS